MLGLIAGYAYGKSRGRRAAARPTDPAYSVWETGVVLGLVFMLVAWPVCAGYWIYRSTRNWWMALLLPLLFGTVGLALPLLWLVGAGICVAYWMTRLQAVDEARVRAAEVDDALAFERALEQRRRELDRGTNGGN